MYCLAQNVEQIADALAHRVDEGVALAAGPFLVADEIKHIADEIDLHNVDAPAFQANSQHPGRQQLANALEQLFSQAFADEAALPKPVRRWRCMGQACLAL